MRVAFVFSTIAAGLALSAPTTETRTYCQHGEVLQDASFESGTTPSVSSPNPWIAGGFIGASTYALTSPGSTEDGGGGNYAFTAILYPGPFTQGNSGDQIWQTMNTCPGQNYSIRADYRFEQTANDSCSVMIRYPYKDQFGSVTTGSGLSPPGIWYTTGSTFQAVTSADPFTVVFRCRNSANNRISVDNIIIAPVNGNAF